MVTSFSSKSELALNLSTDGRAVTFMGYDAPVGRNRRLELQHARRRSTRPTRCPAPTTARWPQLDADGRLRFTETNAYSGNNGRAAILNDARAT